MMVYTNICAKEDEMTLEPKALKPKEAFELLGISRHLGATLIHSGRLHHIKIGRRTVIPTWAIDRLLEEGLEDRKLH